MKRQIFILTCVLCAFSAVSAADKWLQNDGFVSGGTAFYQQGFVSGEIMAAIFEPDPGDYPCQLKTVNTLVQDGASGGTIGAFTLYIWQDTGGLNPGALLYSEGFQLTAGNAFNEIDLTPANIIIPSGNVRVGLEFTQNPPPSFCRDGDGTIQSQTNLIYAAGLGWQWSETFGLQGDWIHRLMIDTNFSSATATPTSTPTPTNTPTNTPPSPPPPTTPPPTNTPAQPTNTPTKTPTFTTPTPGPTSEPTATPPLSTVYFDAEQYLGDSARAIITVEDVDLDSDHLVQETVDVRVWSQTTDPYPGGLTVTLYEEGTASSIFRSVFPHVGFGAETRDADNIIGVSEGETVYVRYIDTTTADERLDSATWSSTTLHLEFLMPGTSFGQGDIFSCDLTFNNAAETVQVDLYILLEVYGDFFCYPAWQHINEGLTGDTTFIPGEESGIISVIPPFAMPEVGAAGPFYFYGAMFEAGELTVESLVSDVAVEAFYLE